MLACAGELRDARRLAGADDLVGDEDVVGEPLAHDDLGLADGGAGEAGAGAGGELAAGDRGRLVRLEVRAQLARAAGVVRGHAVDVALHRRQVDDERGRGDLVLLHNSSSNFQLVTARAPLP